MPPTGCRRLFLSSNQRYDRLAVNDPLQLRRFTRRRRRTILNMRGSDSQRAARRQPAEVFSFVMMASSSMVRRTADLGWRPPRTRHLKNVRNPNTEMIADVRSTYNASHGKYPYHVCVMVDVAQPQDTPRHALLCKVQGNRKSMKPPTTGQIDQLSSAVLSLSAIVIVEVPAVMARVGAALTGAKRGSAMSPTIWPPRLSWVSAAGRSLLCRDGTPSLWRLGYSQCA